MSDELKSYVKESLKPKNCPWCDCKIDILAPEKWPNNRNCIIAGKHSGLCPLEDQKIYYFSDNEPFGSIEFIKKWNTRNGENDG